MIDDSVNPSVENERADAGRPSLSREAKFAGANGDGENDFFRFFPVHLATSRIGNHTRLIPTLLKVLTNSKSMDQPGTVANPARGQLNSENEYFPVRVRAHTY